MNRKREVTPEVPGPPGPKPVHEEDKRTISDLLFSQREKPNGLHEVAIFNVFEDRYRINVWARVQEDGMEKLRIAASYFAVYDGESLNIRA